MQQHNVLVLPVVSYPPLPFHTDYHKEVRAYQQHVACDGSELDSCLTLLATHCSSTTRGLSLAKCEDPTCKLHGPVRGRLLPALLQNGVERIPFSVVGAVCEPYGEHTHSSTVADVLAGRVDVATRKRQLEGKGLGMSWKCEDCDFECAVKEVLERHKFIVHSAADELVEDDSGDPDWVE